MKLLFDFIREKKLFLPLHIHYIRLGKTLPLFESLKKTSHANYPISQNFEITWDKTESRDTSKFLSPRKTEKRTDVCILNIETDAYNLTKIKRWFWYYFINKLDIPLVIIIPDDRKLGAMTQQSFLDKMSLIRLNNIPWKLFSNTSDIESLVLDWAFDVSNTVSKKNELSALQPVKME